MERLQRAIDTFTPPANLGLRVKRDLSYEFYPPDTSQPNYTARVTIKSKIFYKPDRYVPAADKEPKKTDAFGGEEMSTDLAEDPTALRDTDAVFPSQKPLIVEPQLPAPRLDEENVYELTYRDGRWRLETQPESKHEQMWFEYALQP